MRDFNFEQRVTAFWEKVNRNGPIPPHHPDMSNCWIWEGCRNHKNYGTFGIGLLDGKQRNRKAHNVCYFLLNGRWPDEIDHLCHVTLCVRPDHLRSGTHRENINNRRCSYVCKRGHPFEGENIYVYSNGKKRRCRACIPIVRAAWEAKVADRIVEQTQN